MRAIAITSVILFHAGLWPFGSGYAGVDVFFVISGFLIGGIVYRGTADRTFSFAGFYARRARRILPILLVVVLATLITGLLVMSASEMKRLAESAGSAITATSNFFFWNTKGYFSQDAHLDPMLMTWSLGVEEQFYVALPIVLLVLARFGETTRYICLLVLTVASFALCIRLTKGAPVAAFFLLPTRSWELGIGTLLAVWQAQGRRRPPPWLTQALGIAGLLAVLLSMVVFDDKPPFPGAAALLPTLGTAALIAADGSWINGGLLSNRIPVGIGLVSYSWYLWHWPLLAFAAVCSIGVPSVPIRIGVALYALFLAALSWRFVERRFRKPAQPNVKTLILYAGASAALLIVAIGIQLAHGIPGRVSPEVARIEAAVAATHAYGCMTYGPQLRLVSYCTSTKPPVIAVIGDSHAGALAQGVQILGRRNGWGVDVFAKPRCRALLGVTVWSHDSPDLAGDCAHYMDAAFAHVAADPAVTSVILVGQWSGAILNPVDQERYADARWPEVVGSSVALFAQGLDRAVRTLMLAGKHVVVAGDVPFWPFDAARSAIVQAIPPRAAADRLIEGKRAPRQVPLKYMRTKTVEDIAAKVAESAGAGYVDLSTGICPEGICSYMDAQATLFADAHHLTLEGAVVALKPWVGVLFNRSSPQSPAIPGGG